MNLSNDMLQYVGNKDRPIVFFDISIDGEAVGKIFFILYNDITPIACKNFEGLCTGEFGKSQFSGKRFYFKGTKFHKIIPELGCQGGDFTTQDGRGGESIYGGPLADENFIKKDDRKGLLSMGNVGRNNNLSQFLITTIECFWRDGKHMVIGEVADEYSYKIVKKIEACGTVNGIPTKKVIIEDCGVIVEDKGEVRKKFAKDLNKYNLENVESGFP